MYFSRIPCLKFLISSVLLGNLAVADTQQNNSVKYTEGKTYFQKKLEPIPPPSLLKVGAELNEPFPYALISSKDSYLEVCFDKDQAKPTTIRLGKRTAVEFIDLNQLFFIQGSVLFSHRKFFSWLIDSNVSSCRIEGEGTWLTEKTTQGFKIIVLEGDISLGSTKDKKIVKPGELVLTSGEDGQISQSIKIELPLLLGTSRLLTRFPTELSSHSRLISAAQVQAIRMKKRYQAFVGGVSQENKLRIWAIQKNQAEE